jgi:hypothetical protein
MPTRLYLKGLTIWDAQYVHEIMLEGVDYLVFTNLCTRGCIVKKSHIGCKLQH